MWFLTQEGMDRYDGKRIRHYTVLDGNLKVAPQVNLNWLYTDTENTLWVVGRKGRIFHYDTLHDRFRMVYRIPGLQDDFATGMLCYAYMDRGDRIWLCQGDHIIRYDTRTGIAQRLVSRLRGDVILSADLAVIFFKYQTSSSSINRSSNGLLILLLKVSAMWTYLSVVLILLCPISSFTILMSVPCSSR